MVFMAKDKISLRREIRYDAMNPSHKVTKLFKKREPGELRKLITIFNIVTVRIGPKNDRELLVKLREFYSSQEMKPKIVRTRFCFEMFQVIDREPEFFSILTEDLRCFPVVSQIRAKHCQFSKRRISIMYFEKCKMIYLTESSFKLWNDPYLC